MSATGCLVTDVPDFQEPSKTPPFMLESTASPPTSQIVPFEKGFGSFSEQAFSIRVVSEDLDDDLVARFWLSPRSGAIQADILNSAGGGTLVPSTLDDSSRILSQGWRPPSDQQTQGCYELFWIVSHELDQGGELCPVNPADSAQVSWTILVCDSSSCADTVVEGCDDRGKDELVVPCTEGTGQGGGS
ncbi:MAG: hypothetical protein WKG00_01830 [Polyangiaceae bacterium]